MGAWFKRTHRLPSISQMMKALGFKPATRLLKPAKQLKLDAALKRDPLYKMLNGTKRTAKKRTQSRHRRRR